MNKSAENAASGSKILTAANIASQVYLEVALTVILISFERPTATVPLVIFNMLVPSAVNFTSKS